MYRRVTIDRTTVAHEPAIGALAPQYKARKGQLVQERS